MSINEYKNRDEIASLKRKINEPEYNGKIGYVVLLILSLFLLPLVFANKEDLKTQKSRIENIEKILEEKNND